MVVMPKILTPSCEVTFGKTGLFGFVEVTAFCNEPLVEFDVVLLHGEFNVPFGALDIKDHEQRCISLPPHTIDLLTQ